MTGAANRDARCSSILKKFSYQVGNVSSGRTTKCSGTVTERPLSIVTVTSKRFTVDGGFGASFTVP
jgi:hypothetical protein